MASHLNKFNTIFNQLYLIEISFDNGVCALLFLVSLPNRNQQVFVSFVGKEKLKFNDFPDRILKE